MGTLDDAFADVASILTDVFVDKKSTIRRSGEVYNPDTGTRVGTTTNYAVKCAPPTQYSKREIDGVSILANDRRVLVPRKSLPTTDFVINPKTDKFIAPGSADVFSIVSVDAIPSGDENAAYELQLRK